MKIVSIRETSPIHVGEITITRMRVEFDEDVEVYRWDSASQENKLSKDKFITIPANVFNAIMYSAHDKAGVIAKGLFAHDLGVWWNMACEDAELELKITNNDDDNTTSFEGVKLMFSKDEMRQKMLKLGIMYGRGLVTQAKKLRAEVEDALLADIDDVI